MKSILIVINSLWGGGAERIAARLSHLFAVDYQVTVVSLRPLTEKDYSFAGELKSLGYIPAKTFFVTDIKNYARALDRIAEEKRPDIIIAFLQNASFAVSLMKYSKGKKVLSIRNNIRGQYVGIKLHVWEYIIRKYFKKADYVVSVSKAISNEMNSRYGIHNKKCITIYNLYPIQEIQCLRDECLETNEQSFYRQHHVLVNVGHIGKQKAQFRLIKIMPVLVDHFPDIGLVFVGDNSGENKTRDAMLTLAQKLGVADRILYVGRQRNPYKYLKDGTLFVFPSLYEGFPNALAEAMACGVPVLSSDCMSGPREILSPNDLSPVKGIRFAEYGCLIEDSQDMNHIETQLTMHENCLVNAIIAFFSDAELYKHYAEESRNRIYDFSQNIIYAKWRELIEKEKNA